VRNSNFSAARDFVDFGLQERALGRRESISGPGSTRSAAEPVLSLLNRVVKKYRVTSILDLGCGDWNWMQYAAWRSNPRVCYEGWEAHPGLVDDLTKKFGDSRTCFRLADVTHDTLPRADLVVCRDILFHLRLDLALQIIQQLQEYGCILIATSFLEQRRNIDIQPYLPIENWGFYLINLDIAPFNLRRFRIRAASEPECSYQGHRRSVCLYQLPPSGRTGQPADANRPADGPV